MKNNFYDAPSITLLNHASVVIELPQGAVLLTDPWFFGTAFKEGWGLIFNNPKALEEVKRCTHLWVSHFHSDHLHFPTLRKVLELNPEIKVLANDSANFKMTEMFKNVGFKNIELLNEREDYYLNTDVKLTRVPCTGIDNMLFIRTSKYSILNYNDCNLPTRAIETLAKKFGPVDILLTNYNHAGKLMSYPVGSVDSITRKLKSIFKTVVEVWNPKVVIPFASLHYYRSSESQDQNDSLLVLDDLVNIENRVLGLKVGQKVVLDSSFSPLEIINNTEVTQNVREVVDPFKDQAQEDELVKLANAYLVKMKKSFWGLTSFMAPIEINITDLNKSLILNMKSCIATIAPKSPAAQIESHSRALKSWLGDKYGNDGFVVGSHFKILRSQFSGIRMLLLLGLFFENNLDISKIVGLVIRPSGWAFFLHRREEILSILMSGKIMFGSRTEEKKLISLDS